MKKHDIEYEHGSPKSPAGRRREAYPQFYEPFPLYFLSPAPLCFLLPFRLFCSLAQISTRREKDEKHQEKWFGNNLCCNPFPALWLGYNRSPQRKRRQLLRRIPASPKMKKRRLQSEGNFSNFSYETDDTV